MNGAIAASNRQIICLMILTAVVYANAFSGSFQFDDFSAISENPHLGSWRTFVGHLDHMVRPVLYATFLADRTLFGGNETGYHILNWLLHLGCGILMYLVLTHGVTEQERHVPFWTAAFFLVHPLQTETVTYISGRATGLMAFFYLSAFALYLKATEPRVDGPTQRLYLIAALVLFALALGSKETAVTFPLALLLWDMTIRRLTGAALRRSFMFRHAPFWLLLLAVAAAWIFWHPRYLALARFSLEIRPLTENLLSEVHALSYSLRLLFSPWEQNFDHDLPVFHSVFQWPLPLDLVILGGLATAALLTLRRVPLFSFGIGWFFLQLIPTSIIPRNDLLSERNLYLASIGLLLAIVISASHLARRPVGVPPLPKIARIGTAALAWLLISTLALMTIQRNGLYRDPVLLWSDAIEKSPRKARPHNNLGHAYALRGDWDNAIEEFRTAARLDPDYALAQENLRAAYLHHIGRR